jgi:K+-sensing histidine kinase KdpD
MKTSQLSAFSSCKRLNVPFYRCPPVASVFLGATTVAIILTIHRFTDKMRDSYLALVIEISIAASLLLIFFLIVNRLQRNIERIEETREHQHELEELRNEYTHIASRDIAEASTAIKWGIRTLEPSLDLLGKVEQQTLMRIRDRNDHVLDVVRNLTLLARIERKEIIISRAQTDINAVINNLLTITARRTQAHVTQVVYVPPPEPIIISTDHIILADILQSLYTFSLERTRGVSDAISLRAFTLNTGESVMARIIIADNAPPIPEHMRKDIFERVSHNPTTGEMTNTSLGPHVARALAEILGVELIATTTDEQTSFSITFPPNQKGGKK